MSAEDRVPRDATLAELTDLLELLDEQLPPLSGPVSAFDVRNWKQQSFELAMAKNRARALIDQIKGVEQLQLRSLERDPPRPLDLPFVLGIVRDLMRHLGLTFEGARRLTVAEAVAHQTPSGVILGNPSEKPIVNGRTKRRLTRARYDVVKALLAESEDGLSKDSLATKSEHTDAVGILKRLAESDPDWGSVIQLAGKPGGRYRIRAESQNL
jgi:hypothetical protein